MFPTDSGEGNYTVNIQIAQSADFDNWNLVQGDDGRNRDALPNPPDWVGKYSAQQCLGRLARLYTD